MKKFYQKLSIMFALVLLVQNTWAQGVTTSSMTGIVTDTKGEGLPGATVVAIHTPSGTQYGSATNTDGRFVIANMRVGGPYTVNVSYLGFQTKKVENLTLRLGEQFVLNTSLSESGTALQEVVISGTKDKLLNAEKTGATTNISTTELQNLPTISRSLNDFVRITPQSSPTSNGAIGGGNYRQNNITIDGADFNNNFGIGGNLPGGGSPISLDAIEEISVNVTPFDVRQSGFIGSAVNAVTRSGTNEYKGSVYTFWRSDKFQGDKVGEETFTKQPLDEQTYGFRLGGPVLKNKLFFFINAEKREATSPGPQNIASTPDMPFGGSNTPSNVARPTESDLNMISDYLREQYGYETGPYQNYPFVSDRTQVLARIDWNINNNNRIALRYNHTEGKTPSSVSTSRSPLSAFSNSRTSNFALPFKNSNYYQETNFKSVAAEWNSSWGIFANTLRGTYTHQDEPRSSDSQVFPFVDILKDNNPYTSFGYEPFSYGNLRDVKSFSIVDNVTFIKGIHTFTGGFQYDNQSTKNGFQRFATSYYTFNSWEAFVSGANPSAFALTYSLLPEYEQAYPRFKFAQASIYAQDEISLTDRLKITAGLRAERNMYLEVDEIQTHPLVADLTFTQGRKIDTGVLPDNKILYSPRVGFNWDVKGDRSLQVRGGTGIFSGRVPTVWIVAQSGDAGLLQVTQTWTAPNLPFANMPFNPDPNAYRPTTQPTPGSVIPSAISATDPNFKNPQAWKSTLAVDTKLPGGIVATVEGIYNKDLVIAYGKNYNLVDPKPLNVEGYPDNRPIYPSSNTQKFINPLTSSGQVSPTGTSSFNTIVLSNGYDGYYWSVSAKLEKQFNNGLAATVAYVRSDARVLYDGSGDQLINTWSGTPIVGEANKPELSYANYVVPSRVIASISYRKEFLKHLGTTVSLFYEGSTQGRYSYTYSSDFNRDGQTNDLIYVPKDATEITFTDFNYGTTAAPKTYTAAQQSELFFRMVEQDPYLKTRKGQYAERNGAMLPWRNQIDVRFAQDIFVDVAGKRNALQFTADIFNFGNMLNKEWGIVRLVNNNSILVPTNVSSLSPDGTVKPTFRLATDRNQPITTTFRNNNALASTYYMQLGLRYTFN